MKRIISLAILIGLTAATLSLVAASLASAAGDACYGGLCLPTRTWIERRLPDWGVGPCTATFWGNCKEVHPAFNYANGRIYYFGGDYSLEFWGSTYSYGVLDNSWITEYPNYGLPGDSILDNTADEIPWVYDSKRNLFYYLGGFGGSCCYGHPAGTTSNGAVYADPPLTFNPATKKWSRNNFPYLPEQHAVYDPVTDRVYLAGDSGMRILNPESGAIETVQLDRSDRGEDLHGGIGFQRNVYYDIDIPGRAIYLVNAGNIYGPWTQPTRLYRYNIDLRTTTVLQSPPQQDNMYYPQVVWDSVNRVVLWWTAWDKADYGSVLWIYHPDTGSWEKDPMFNPSGLRPLGSSFAFDPVHNVAILMGSTDNGGDFAHGEIDHMFLYRYGNGDGSVTPPPAAPPPPPPPPANPGPVPSTLQGSFMGRDQDRVGQMNQTTPNGVPDFHISVSGVRSTPVRVRITSDTGGIWEVPFNGANWIVGAQFNGSTGDFWFEPINSGSFHVVVTYADGTTDGADAAVPAAVGGTIGAAFLGIDQDRVGENRTTADGVSDFHISVTGLRGTPVTVRITSDTGGIWETPFNGSNWVITTQFNGSAGDFWFEPFTSNRFHVKVTYADGTTDDIDAT